MTVKSGAAWADTFVCVDGTGAFSTPSVGPAGTLYVDGVANAATVTITGSNPYKWSVTLPALTASQRASMYIAATIDGVATGNTVASEQADTVLESDTYGKVDAEVADIQARLPAALTGDGNLKVDVLKIEGVDATDAITAAAEAALASTDTTVGAIAADVTTLLSRLSATRAGYLDNLSAGAVATAAKLLSLFQSALRNDVTVDPDIGGTYNDAAHSQQALAAASAPSAATIADAVWDEAIAGHLTAGSTGLALNGAGGAAGSGAITYTYTVTNSDDGLPIAGVAVWVTTDSAGTNVVAGTLVTDSFGVVTFYLDAGTYYLWRQLAGWTFANPDTEVVS